jgi:hypothetical protein
MISSMPEPKSTVDTRLTLSLNLWGSKIVCDSDGVQRVQYLPHVDPGPLEPIALRIEDGIVYLAPKDAIANAGAIIDVATTIAGFSCCHLQAEIEVLAGGQHWDGTCPDHLWHIMNWYPAVLRALESDPAVASTFVWDESGLGLSRDGDRLTITDPNAPTIEVSTLEFGRAMLREGRLLAKYAGALRAEVLDRAGSAEELEALVPINGPDRPTSPEPGDVVRVCAIVWRELRYLDELPNMLEAIEVAL